MTSASSILSNIIGEEAEFCLYNFQFLQNCNLTLVDDFTYSAGRVYREIKKMHCRFRLLTICIALFSILFMQCAVASYVCPGMSEMAAMTMSVDSSNMPGCEGMDKNQPSLCHAHAQDTQNKQSLDKPPFPNVQPFIATGLILALYVIDFDALLAPVPPESLILARSNAPPIAILNCCFRI